MENKKSNIIIIILLALVAVLVSYIAYDKINLNNNNQNNNTSTTTTTTTSTSTTTITKKVIDKNDEENPSDEDEAILKQLGFPKADDNSINSIDGLASLLTENELFTNFKNLVKNKNNISITYTCTNFSKIYDNEPGSCLRANANINNKVNIEVFTSASPGVSGDRLYYNDNYYIIINENHGVARATITIYNSNGKELSVIEDVDLNVGENDSAPKIQNKKLYFIVAPYNEEDSEVTAHYKYIDLSNTTFKIVEIKQFKLNYGVGSTE